MRFADIVYTVPPFAPPRPPALLFLAAPTIFFLTGPFGFVLSVRPSDPLHISETIRDIEIKPPPFYSPYMSWGDLLQSQAPPAGQKKDGGSLKWNPVY
jgi:hypothetical protein